MDGHEIVLKSAFGNAIVSVVPYVLGAITGVILRSVGFSKTIFSSRLDRPNTDALLKKIADAAIWPSEHIMLKGKPVPHGWVIARKFFAHVTLISAEGDFVIHLFHGCPLGQIIQTHEPKQIERAPPGLFLDFAGVRGKRLKCMTRVGTYAEIEWAKTLKDMDLARDNEKQAEYAHQILDKYLASPSRNLKVLLLGRPNCGKTFLGYLLASHLDGIHVDQHRPTEPGDLFQQLQDRAAPSKEAPLVVVYNEWDGVITDVDAGRIPRHDEYITEVRNKSTLNDYLDRLQFVKGFLGVFTSNKTKEWLGTIDPAYLRPGRIDMTIEC